MQALSEEVSTALRSKNAPTDLCWEVSSEAINDIPHIRTEYLDSFGTATTFTTFQQHMEAALVASDWTLEAPQHDIYLNWTYGFSSDHTRIPASEKAVITVGRHTRCDCVIPDCISHISRLQFIAIHVRREHQTVFVIVDMWSFGGTGVKDTNIQSVPGKYRLLFLSADEPVSLQLGIVELSGERIERSLELGFNLRECNICMQAPRASKLSCGHCVACRDCTQRLRICPICRDTITFTSAINAREGLTYAIDSAPASEVEMNNTVRFSRASVAVTPAPPAHT